MALYPGAAWRPLGPQTQGRMTQVDIICLHTMVGSLWGTDTYFRSGGYGGTEAHFGIGHDGTILQWQDTAYTADANLNGNWHLVSIETADVGVGFPAWNTNDGSAVPAWTPAQVDALARLVAWCCRVHGVPCELIPDSRPGRRGIGYHRQGVDPFRVPGGERWSSAYGKVCPGNRRIAQIPGVIENARRILGGGQPRRRDNMLQNIRIEPGSGNIRLNIPCGVNSRVVAQAWISASVDGPAPGEVHLFFQDDDSGLSDVRLAIGFADGRSTRAWWEVPNGNTTVSINYVMPDGGVVTVEALSK